VNAILMRCRQFAKISVKRYGFVGASMGMQQRGEFRQCLYW
jgi:hypothetical protein